MTVGVAGRAGSQEPRVWSLIKHLSPSSSTLGASLGVGVGGTCKVLSGK